MSDPCGGPPCVCLTSSGDALDAVALRRKVERLRVERDRYREPVEASAKLKCRHYPDRDFNCRTRGGMERERWCAPCLARAALDGDHR